MAEITLSDYTGFIFRELIHAREMADAYSRQVAEIYANDAVLKHFSVPRFKIPKIDLTIPVLISGARYAQAVEFVIPRERFVDSILGRSHDVVAAVRRSKLNPFPDDSKTNDKNPPDVKPIDTIANVDDKVRRLAEGFLDQLLDNPDPSKPSGIVDKWWQEIFGFILNRYDVISQYKEDNPTNELYTISRDDLMKFILNNTIVKSTEIQSLLVNPETNVVKNGSDAASVFTIRAEMIEEGFFLRSIKDEKTGETRPVVEFE